MYMRIERKKIYSILSDVISSMNSFFKSYIYFLQWPHRIINLQNLAYLQILVC